MGGFEKKSSDISSLHGSADSLAVGENTNANPSCINSDIERAKESIERVKQAKRNAVSATREHSLRLQDFEKIRATLSSASNVDDEERLLALSYEREYRERLTLSKDSDADSGDASDESQKETNDEASSPENTDSADNEYSSSDKTEEGESPKSSDKEKSGVIEVNEGLKSDILHIDGMRVGSIAFDRREGSLRFVGDMNETFADEPLDDGVEFLNASLVDEDLHSADVVGDVNYLSDTQHSDGIHLPYSISPLSEYPLDTEQGEIDCHLATDGVDGEGIPLTNGERYRRVSDEHLKREELLAFDTRYAGGSMDGQAEYAPFDRKMLKKAAKASSNTDIRLIEERYYSELRELERELDGVRMAFGSTRRARVHRTHKEIKRDIARLNAESRSEIKRARKDNKRYFEPVLTNYMTSELPLGAERNELLAMRSELLSLLERRDELSGELIGLYSGRQSGRRGSDGERSEQERRARRRAYQRQKKLAGLIIKYHVSYDYSKKLHALMDEYVELSGELSGVNYTLRKQKPKGVGKRELLKKRKKLKRRLRKIDTDIDYYKYRAIRKAKDRRESRINMTLGWSAFFLLLLLGIIAFLLREPIGNYLGSLIGK